MAGAVTSVASGAAADGAFSTCIRPHAGDGEGSAPLIETSCSPVGDASARALNAMLGGPSRDRGPALGSADHQAGAAAASAKAASPAAVAAATTTSAAPAVDEWEGDARCWAAAAGGAADGSGGDPEASEGLWNSGSQGARC
jgi:hypothetical protein